MAGLNLLSSIITWSKLNETLDGIENTCFILDLFFRLKDRFRGILDRKYVKDE